MGTAAPDIGCERRIHKTAMAPPTTTDIQQLAHDLRSSLRAISIYADLLTREVQQDETNMHNIERFCLGISTATEELAANIDALDSEHR